MSDKPTLEAIRARLANHTQVLAQLHYARDVGALVELVDQLAIEAHGLMVDVGEWRAQDRQQRDSLSLAHAERDQATARIAELEAKLAEMEEREAKRAAFAARQHAALDALNNGLDVSDVLLAPDGPAPPLSDDVVEELLGGRDEG